MQWLKSQMQLKWKGNWHHETATHLGTDRRAASDRQVAKRETRKEGTQVTTQAGTQGKAIET